MKGIILAGGSGTRLYPLSSAINKHLMPVYDKPMIYYSISTVMLSGIRDILIISSPHHLPSFQSFLGDGSQWGVKFSYVEQEKPAGLTQAFTLGEEFIGDDNVCLMLGDNIFHGSGLEQSLTNAVGLKEGATLFAYYVENPSSYGVVEFDENQKATAIIEKPQQPKSNYAITGLYFYDNNVIEVAKQVKPSWRGELEISDLNAMYLRDSVVNIEFLGRGFTWLDMGTHDALLKASNYVEVIEARQGLKIGCPEEVALRKGYIDCAQMKKLAEQSLNEKYRKYLLFLAENPNVL